MKENVNYKKGTEMKYRDGYSVIIYTRTPVRGNCEFNKERYEFFDYTEAEKFFLKQRDRFGGRGTDCPSVRMCACRFKMNRGVIIKSSDQYYMMEYITRNGETEIYRYPEKREPFPVFEAGKEYVSSDGKGTVEILSRTKCYITVRINRTETKKCRIENLCATEKRPVEACFDKDIGWVEARNKKP